MFLINSGQSMGQSSFHEPNVSIACLIETVSQFESKVLCHRRPYPRLWLMGINMAVVGVVEQIETQISIDLRRSISRHLQVSETYYRTTSCDCDRSINHTDDSTILTIQMPCQRARRGISTDAESESSIGHSIMGMTAAWMP